MPLTIREFTKEFDSVGGADPTRLDIELILAHTLGKPREWIIAHPEHLLSESEEASSRQAVIRRKNNEPLAYLTSEKEFYGRSFFVTPDVLIRRPETEQMIELVKKYAKSQPKILDVGTGSGCIGITLTKEIPDSIVTISDISDSSFSLAQKNSMRIGSKVTSLKSDLLDNIDSKFDIVVANLPYVGKSWAVSPETAFEPELALFAEDDGLALIKKLIIQSPKNLNSKGLLVLELDTRQINETIKFAESHNFSALEKLPFSLALLYDF